MPWLQDEVVDSNLSQVYEDTPPLSLGESVAGDRGDTGKVEYNHGGADAGERCDMLQMDNFLLGMGVQDQRCRTNIVRWNTGAQNGTKKIQELARSGGNRLDHEDWAGSTLPDT